MVGYRLLADIVVVVHAAFVAFVVLGLVAILVGLALRREWARSFWFRTLHLAAIGIVAAQAWVGVLCPLTLLEKALRRRAGQATYPGSFIGHWAHELIFVQAPPWAFTACYTAFGLVVLAAFLLSPPRWPRRRLVPARRHRAEPATVAAADRA